MIRNLLFVFCIVCSGSVLSENVKEDNIYASDIAKGKYNRIVLPEPYKTIVISKGAKIDKPIKLNSGRLLLIRPKSNALKMFDITFVLASGETFQLYLNPVLQDRAIVWRFNDAADVQEEVGNTLNDKHLWLSRLFPEAHDVYFNRTEGNLNAPRGFTSIKTPSTLSVAVKSRTNQLIEVTMTPARSWRGMGHTLNGYQLT